MVLRMRRRVILLIYKAVRIVLFDERQQIVLLHVDVPLWVEIASHNNQRGIATPRNSSSQHDPAAYLLAFGKYVAREAEVAPKLGQAVRNVQTNRFFQRPHRQKSCSRANWNRSLFCSLFSLTRSFAGPKMKCSSFARVFCTVQSDTLMSMSFNTGRVVFFQFSSSWTPAASYVQIVRAAALIACSKLRVVCFEDKMRQNSCLYWRTLQ